MKTIIAGGRKYSFTESDFKFLDMLKDQITEVVCGKAPGADTEGENWAKANGIPVKPFPAHWKTQGKKAGAIRNKLMANYASSFEEPGLCILFPGGDGTANMEKQARKRKENLILVDLRYNV